MCSRDATDGAQPAGCDPATGGNTTRSAVQPAVIAQQAQRRELRAADGREHGNSIRRLGWRFDPSSAGGYGQPGIERVSYAPVRNASLLRIATCIGIVVGTPSTVNAVSAPTIFAIASSRVAARTISFASSES